jgi:hypothetical protein
MASCSVDVAEEDPIVLFDGLRSFQTPAQAQESLTSVAPMRVVEDTPVKDRMHRVVFRTVTAEVQNYSHQGHHGRLVLQFLNDRLMRVMFYPTDPAAFLQALQGQGIESIPDSTWANRFQLKGAGQPSALQNYAYSDMTGGQYVAWADARLNAEYHQWVTAYN